MAWPNAHPQSMRAFLARLEAAGQLLRIPDPVSLDFEISAFVEHLADGPAVLFENVTGHELPVVGNLLNSLDRIAAGIGVPLEDLHPTLAAAVDAPLAPTVVEEAHCQEVIIEEPDLDDLPIPKFFEHETGPYITAGAIVAKDSTSGRANLSIARLKPLGGNKAFIGIAPNHHLAVLARAAHARGEKLGLAVTIGNHPATMIASAYYLRLGDDELEIAGALLREPVEVVPARTVDALVPAHCELVLEGTLDQGTLVEEGAVSEFHGMYEHYKKGPVVTFHCMTRRRDALFQVIEPGFSPEHVLIGATAIAAVLARHVRSSVPSLRQAAVTDGGCGRLHAVFSLDDPRPGDARKAMFAAWGAVNLIKKVTVVDGDIDPNDPRQVEWAEATRVRWDRDLVVVPRVRADRADPMEHEGLVTKVGIDATRGQGDRPDWRFATVPDEVRERVRAKITELGIGS